MSQKLQRDKNGNQTIITGGIILFYFSGMPFDKTVIHAVESVVIEWSHQIRGVLKKTSAQPLLDGKFPWPTTELDFWKARYADLESIVDQVPLQ